MTAIYVLNDAGFPDAASLADLLTAGVGSAYEVQTLEQLELVQASLENERQAVVFLSASPEQLPLTVQKLRMALPSAVAVSVVPESRVDTTPVLEADALFLRHPYDRFSVMSILGAALRQSELLATVADCAQMDDETKLFNRRYFIQRLSEEISLSKRHLTPLCCIVVGINFYQMYLDSYGYDFINAYVRYIAQFIANKVRHEDIVAHITDDEIGILLPRSTEKGAKIFTNRLILELNSMVYEHQGFSEEVNVCAGVAGYPLPDGSPADADTIIRYARHALHHARCSEEEHVRVQLFSEIQPAI